MRFYSFSFLAPLTLPALWFLGSEPKFAQPSADPQGTALRAVAKLVSDPNNQREPTAIFGRVLKQRKYTCRGALRQENRIFLFTTCLSNGYFFALNTRPNMAVGPLFRP